MTALIDQSNGSVVASCEYGPFGEALRSEGVYAKTNPFRFSTKWTDEETSLVYYGHRYYSPDLGRWDYIAQAAGAKTANSVSSAMSWVNVPLTTPIVVASALPEVVYPYLEQTSRNE